ncbi:TIGR02234 family membrane protein [Mycolicibacterium sp. Y3]
MIRIAQALLALAALALWGASRLTWVQVSSFDGLGQPKTSTLTGGQWSTALIPLALVLLAAAVAALAVRGWALRLLAVLVAVSSAAMAYLGISLWVVRDIAVRGADLAQVPVAALVGSSRQYLGAGITVGAAVLTLAAAVLLIRSAATARGTGTKYVAPAVRREAVTGDSAEDGMSERMIWDALDEGSDPTDPDAGSDTKGR